MTAAILVVDGRVSRDVGCANLEEVDRAVVQIGERRGVLGCEHRRDRGLGELETRSTERNLGDRGFVGRP